MTLEHKSSLKSLGYMCINSQKYIVWVKINDFSFMPKTFDIKIMFHEDIFIFPTVNISKRNFVLVTCIKSFIWTNFFAPSDSSFSNSLHLGQILSDPKKTYINGNIIYSAFI